MESKRDDSGELVDGTLIADRYRLGREIARGGMGIVCEARHIETGRTVAIKLLARKARNADLIELRLRREAHALGALQHPGILEVLDAGTCPRMGYFVVMEKLEGRSLDGLLAARRRLGIEEALWVAKACGEALAYAHGKGVVHRDIKPANIFVSVVPGEGERLKIIDFGLAGFDAADGPRSAKLTAPGDLLGTLEYIAPEQLSHPEMHEPRSDLYALASVLYECLTGELPTLADRVGSPPNLLDLCAVRPGVEPRIAEAIVRALQVRPDERFACVADFISALEAVEPIRSCRLMPSSRSVRHVPTESEKPTRAEGRRTPPDAVGRRKHPRAPYITPCRVLFEDGHHVDGRSEDISVGGLLVVASSERAADSATATPRERRSEERVTLRFSLPTTGAIVNLPGTVRWLTDGRGRSALGVEFIDPPPATHMAISRYVEIIGQPSSS